MPTVMAAISVTPTTRRQVLRPTEKNGGKDRDKENSTHCAALLRFPHDRLDRSGRFLGQFRKFRQTFRKKPGELAIGFKQRFLRISGRGSSRGTSVRAGTSCRSSSRRESAPGESPAWFRPFHREQARPPRFVPFEEAPGS